MFLIVKKKSAKKLDSSYDVCIDHEIHRSVSFRSPEFGSFLQMCLLKDPSKRPTSDELLNSVFLAIKFNTSLIMQVHLSFRYMHDCLLVNET